MREILKAWIFGSGEMGSRGGLIFDGRDYSVLMFVHCDHYRSVSITEHHPPPSPPHIFPPPFPADGELWFCGVGISLFFSLLRHFVVETLRQCSFFPEVMMTCSSLFFHIWYVPSCKYWYVRHNVWFLVNTCMILALVVLMIPSFRQQSQRYFVLAPNFWIACTKNLFNYKKNGANYPIPHHLTQKFVPQLYIRPTRKLLLF